MSEMPVSHRHVRVALTQEDDYPPFDSEELDVRVLADGTAVLMSPPAFAPSLAVGDVVAIAEDEQGVSWITEVVTEGDHWTVRVVPLDGTPLDQLVAQFSKAGLTAYESHGMVVGDAGPDVDVAAVFETLDARFAAGEWDYDVGVDPRL